MWQDEGKQQQVDAPPSVQADQLESRQQQRLHRQEMRKVVRAQSQALLDISNGESPDEHQSDVRTSAAALPTVTEPATKSPASRNADSQQQGVGHENNGSPSSGKRLWADARDMLLQTHSKSVRSKQISGENSIVKQNCLHHRGPFEKALQQHFLQQRVRSRAFTTRKIDRRTALDLCWQRSWRGASLHSPRASRSFGT